MAVEDEEIEGTARLLHWPRTQISIHPEDWWHVKRGARQQWRLPLSEEVPRVGISRALLERLPAPVLVTCPTRLGSERALFMLDACWIEPFAAISERSLELEGFDASQGIAAYRRTWMARTEKKFRPVQPTAVYSGHLASYDEAGKRICELLYGEYL